MIRNTLWHTAGYFTRNVNIVRGCTCKNENGKLELTLPGTVGYKSYVLGCLWLTFQYVS